MIQVTINAHYIRETITTGSVVDEFVITKGTPLGARLVGAGVNSRGDLLLIFDDRREELNTLIVEASTNISEDDYRYVKVGRRDRWAKNEPAISREEYDDQQKENGYAGT